MRLMLQGLRLKACQIVPYACSLPCPTCQVAEHLHGHLVRQVWYIGHHTSSKFISDICVRMSVSTWAKNERVVSPNCLNVVSRGLVGRGGRLLGRAQVSSPYERWPGRHTAEGEETNRERGITSENSSVSCCEESN